MKFFKNKLNIILTLILLILICVGVLLGIKFFKQPAVKAIDFKSMNEQEIVSWASENNVSELIEFKHEYSNDVSAGNVIYQSLKEGDEIIEPVLIIISDGIDTSNMLEIPVSSLNTLSSFESWAKNNNFTNYNVEYVLDTNKDEETILSIDPTVIDTNTSVNVKVSTRKNIDVPDFSYMSEEEISTWSKDNAVKIKYENEYSSSSKGSFIKQSIVAGGRVEGGETIIITVSKGPKDTNSAYIDENKYLGYKEEDFLKELKELGFTNVVLIDEINSKKYDEGTICYYLPDGKQKKDTKIEYKVSLGVDGKKTDSAYIDEKKYLGVKEEDFLKELEDLGFTNVVKIDEVYSNTRAKGTICYYLPDGKQKLDTKIEYKVSKGKEGESSAGTAYIDEYKYLGYKEEDFLKELKELGFTNLVKIDEISSSKYKAGTICYYLPDGKQKLDTKIEYKIVKGSSSSSSTKAYIDPYKYLGYKEADFVKALKDLGFTNVVKIDEISSAKYKEGTICYYLPDGEQSIDKKIEYKIVKSTTTPTTTKVKVPTITSNPCTGTSTSCTLTNPNLKYKVSYVYSDSVAEGKIISISPNSGTSVDENSTVNVSISKGKEPEKTYTIMEWTEYQDVSLGKTSVDETKTWITEILGNFDLSFIEKSDRNLNVGNIISISVNGNSSYSAGSYPASTKVVVTICNKQGK